MKLFLDSGNLAEIEESLKRGFLGGVTTNPSILSKEAGQPKQQVRRIVDLLLGYDLQIPLSVELSSTKLDIMKSQAEEILNDFEDYDNLYIKVPIGWDNLKIIKFIHDIGGNVNCTCCMSYNQAVMAAATGASYVSMFWGRIRDTGYDAASVVRQIHRSFQARGTQTEIIVGSIRQMIDINEAIQAGADIVTVPYAFLSQMCTHPKTDEVVAQFMADSVGHSS